MNTANSVSSASNDFKSKISAFKQRLIHHFKNPPKMGWIAYIARAAATLTLLFFCVYLFTLRYTIESDFQSTTSIQGVHMLLIDKDDKELRPGFIYAFKSPDLRPFYSEGTKIAKFYFAGPGDTVKIDENNQIWLNGVITAYSGLEYAQSKLGLPESKFRGSVKLNENQYWFLGNSPKSFDSRYWGPIGSERIIGRAMKVF